MSKCDSAQACPKAKVKFINKVKVKVKVKVKKINIKAFFSTLT